NSMECHLLNTVLPKLHKATKRPSFVALSLFINFLLNLCLTFWGQFIMEAMGFFVLRPYIVFLLTAVLVMYSFKKKDKDRYLFLLVLMVAVFYYGAFVINTQSFEIRYFYPSLYLMAVMDTALIADFVHSLSERSSKHRERIAEKTVSEKKK
ncbi:hypothetical protein, partial [Ruminococcus flavefaciens]|uniref:hypothetical protein n=1 Tax=Ruminococcus flavefaciens TaxID=1265 RepID=UPI0026F0F462